MGGNNIYFVVILTRQIKRAAISSVVHESLLLACMLCSTIHTIQALRQTSMYQIEGKLYFVVINDGASERNRMQKVRVK